MKRNRYLTILLCFLLTAALLAGCGGAGNSSEAMEQEYAMAETMAASDSITGSTSLSSYSDANAKLIRTVYLDAQTQQYDALVTALDEKIASLGGYIENRDAYNGSEYYGYSNRYCNLTVRIPADRLDEFITHVNENCNVINTSESVENVTLQYADTESRVQALETEQARLLELLENAQNMTEILEIEERLSDVRYELTSYASQLKVLDNQVTYATVHLNIDEVERLTPTEEPTVWERISEGFGDTLDDIADVAVEFFIWFVVNLPWIAIWCVAGSVVVVIIRATRRKSKKNRKEQPPVQEPGEE